ncbi:MAG: DUF3090 family protein [Actinomycetota bacterium]|nr:DUF3090 family protein [Actinomycetota bacterium]
MDRPEIDWDDTDAFTAGAVGPQGRRVFFIQARRDGSVVSLKLEKQQVAGLAEFFAEMLSDLPALSGSETDDVAEEIDFDDPGEPDWVIGSLGAAYQQSTDRLVLFAEELVRDEDAQPAQARFPLSRAQVVTFIDKARLLVEAGREPCPLCGAPLDPAAEGWCPCVN